MAVNVGWGFRFGPQTSNEMSICELVRGLVLV